MQGMSSTEWGAYLREHAGLDVPADEVVDAVLERLLDSYRRDLPLLPGAVEAVRRVAADWPVALASSSNRSVIDLVLEHSGLAGTFAATVSSEEVTRGKPSPDVYLEAAARLGVDPARCAAVEDSTNGIRSALAAGMVVVAVPNPHYPPPEEVLGRAALVVASAEELQPARAPRRRRGHRRPLSTEGRAAEKGPAQVRSGVDAFQRRRTPPNPGNRPRGTTDPDCPGRDVTPCHRPTGAGSLTAQGTSARGTRCRTRRCCWRR